MREIFVYDSTPLIYLGKLKVLEKLPALSTQNIIPHTAYVEVVERGLQRGSPDAAYVERLSSKKIFTVMRVAGPPIMKPSSLDAADIEVLTLAKRLSARAILDDAAARLAAEAHPIKMGGSIYLLFRLLSAKIISKQECRECVDRMLGAGWRCSPEMYAAILRELEAFKA